MEENQKYTAPWHHYFRLGQRWVGKVVWGGACQVQEQLGLVELLGWEPGCGAKKQPSSLSIVLQGLVCPLHALSFTWELVCPLPPVLQIVVGHLSSLALEAKVRRANNWYTADVSKGTLASWMQVIWWARGQPTFIPHLYSSKCCLPC